MPLPVVPILPAPLDLAQRLARLVDLDVERQDQRARFADEQARAHVDADRLEPLDLAEQVRRIDDHAVADVAGHAVAHDARGDQLQRRLHALDDQRVAGVVAALEAHHALRMVGQPVDHLALAFVAPLGADDDHVAAARRIACLLISMTRFSIPRWTRHSARTTHCRRDVDELAVAVEFLRLVLVAGQHADHRLALLAQAADRGAQRRVFAPAARGSRRGAAPARQLRPAPSGRG